ncbi:MAG: hypothetical protein LLF89_02380 [Spirochaetaceae bacterium]|nr:hypothetical protein [Spirochaetaceae bacterium]
MTALLIGIVLLAVSVGMCLPGGFNWWNDVLAFLRGSLPVIALLVGIVAVLVGIADIRDKKEAEKEEKEEKEEASAEKKNDVGKAAGSEKTE